MKLQAKMIISVTILLIIVFSVFAIISYSLEKELIYRNMAEVTQDKVNEVIESISTQATKNDLLRLETNGESLLKAKTLSLMIENNPQILENPSQLNKIKELLAVDEINVCDENGIIKWTTVTDYVGFDMNSTEQTRPFMEAITNKGFELAQEPTGRGIDDKLFQYVGVARQDKPGIIQVGLEPERLQKALASSDIKNIAQDVVFGQQGYVFIIDSISEVTVSHKDKSCIGDDANQFDFYNEIKGKENGNFIYNHDGIEKFMSFKEANGYIVCATIPVSEYTEGLTELLRKMIILSCIALVFCALLQFIIIKSAVDPIKNVSYHLSMIADADFTNEVSEKHLGRKDEIGLMAKSVEDMQESIRTLIKEI
ncbi:HAMP domain-containing protein [Lutispora sp.]|uniref:HAMP domain-containing protein n=1 Tax=Lutispora sp. TaxID=2828727 RepID=UPI0035661856